MLTITYIIWLYNVYICTPHICVLFKYVLNVLNLMYLLHLDAHKRAADWLRVWNAQSVLHSDR